MSANLPLEDLEIYQLALGAGEHVWTLVDRWVFFPKKTVGGQFVDAADSIAANIAEGYGRYFIRIGNNFVTIAGGRCWKQKPGQERLLIVN